MSANHTKSYRFAQMKQMQEILLQYIVEMILLITKIQKLPKKRINC